MNKYYFIVLRIMAALCLIVFGSGKSGMAASPSLYSIDMQYAAEQAAIPEQLKADVKTRGVIIAVTEFNDARPVADKKIIGWVKELDGTKILVTTRAVAQTRAASNAIKDYLKTAGYQVADKLVPWDLKEETMPKGSGKVIVGGSIEDMEVTCWTGVFSNDYKINLKLTLVVADSAKGTILYKGNVTTTYSKTDTSFSEGQLGRQASLAFSDAIVKVFEGKMVAQKIKEAAIK